METSSSPPYPAPATSSTAAPQISIVAPLWNESANVCPLAERVFLAFSNELRSLELLLVDDASTDDTWTQILEAQKTHPRIRALRLVQHRGQSAALWTGFQASRGQFIATLDGDLQNDPADLPKLIAALQNCDLACGVRARRQDNFRRRVSTRIARRARRLALGVDFQDTGCNLRAFKRSVVSMLFPFDGLHRFMPILAHDAGAVVRELPVTHHPRVAGRSKYGVWNRLGRGIFDLVVISWARKRQLNNLQFVEYPGEQTSPNSRATPLK